MDNWPPPLVERKEDNESSTSSSDDSVNSISPLMERKHVDGEIIMSSSRTDIIWDPEEQILELRATYRDEPGLQCKLEQVDPATPQARKSNSMDIP